jgi:hypothetical protein
VSKVRIERDVAARLPVTDNGAISRSSYRTCFVEFPASGSLRCSEKHGRLGLGLLAIVRHLVELPRRHRDGRERRCRLRDRPSSLKALPLISADRSAITLDRCRDGQS